MTLVSVTVMVDDDYTHASPVMASTPATSSSAILI